MRLSIKSLVVVALSIFFVASTSSAEVSLGLKGGLNLAKQWGGDSDDEIDGETMKPGLIIGAALELQLAEMFSIQPEAYFSMKGVKASDELMGTSYSVVMNFNYIEIPVLFKLNIPAGVIVPTFFVGPAIAFRAGVNGYAKMGDDKEDMPKEQIDAIKENTKVFDFGLAMGGGANIEAGPGNVIIDVRYTLGLVKVSKLTDEAKDMGETEDDLSKRKNGALSFIVGYAFNLGG